MYTETDVRLEDGDACNYVLHIVGYINHYSY